MPARKKKRLPFGKRRAGDAIPGGVTLNNIDRSERIVKYACNKINRRNPQYSSERQSLYLEALATNPNLSILYGQYLSKPGRCYTCGATWPNFEEKMTDVNIATELLTDAFTDQFDTAIVVSADSDLVPPIRAIRTFFPRKRIVVAFPPARASKEMRSAAHASLIIGHGTLAKSQLPDQITKPDGFIVRHPKEWR
ncbi:MAG: NYN domain-containing protein [Tepidisphaerales bacterium]